MERHETHKSTAHTAASAATAAPPGRARRGVRGPGAGIRAATAPPGSPAGGFLAMASGAAVLACAAAPQLVAGEDGIRTGSESPENGRPHAGELGHGCSLFGAAPCETTALRAAGSAHAVAGRGWRGRNFHDRALAAAGPAAGRRGTRPGGVLEWRRLVGAGIPLLAWSVRRLSPGSGIPPRRCDAGGAGCVASPGGRRGVVVGIFRCPGHASTAWSHAARGR